MSKIYVPKDPTKRDKETGNYYSPIDLKPALEHGDELVYVFDAGSHNPMLQPGPTTIEVRHALRNYCDDDYIIMIGDPTLASLVAMAASHFNAGRVNFLLWDNRLFKYLKVRVEL